MKIDLLPSRNPRSWRSTANSSWIMLRASLPYWRSNAGGYVHRVRDGAIHIWRHNEYPTHAAYKCWCGYTGQSSRGTLLADPGDGVLCATCEGRAIGTMLYVAPYINDRLVRFAPRIAE